ncbi:MAG: hypothetical protein Q9226_002244 [Calogaya cf. arnoldii]
MSGYPNPSESSGSRSSSSEYEFQVKRRRVQDDRGRSDIPTPPPDTPIAQEGYSMQKFRVGVPPLQILPLETIKIDEDNEVVAAVWAEIPIFKWTCTINHITLLGTGTDAFEFVYRTVEGQAPTAEHMILCVKAEWTDGCSRVWAAAANTIRASLRGNPITSAVRVEFISWQLFRPRFTEPLRDDDPIVNAWPQLRPEIHRLLNQSQLVSQNWLAIMVIRRGYIQPETEENNGVELTGDTSVVLLVITSYDIDPHQWAPQAHEIKRLLVQSGLHFVQVEFERGSNDHLAFPLLPPTKPDRHNHAMIAPYDFKIVLGVDCGPARYFEVDGQTGQGIPDPNGTVGGIVLVTKSDGTVKKMAVLNYHIARDVLEGSSFTQGVQDPVHADAPPNSELEFVDRNGLRPNARDTTHMLLESPSRKKHNYTLQYLEKEMQECRDDLATTNDPEALQADLKILEDKYNDRKKFFDDGKHILGKLWMASGFTRRTSYNGRLDWALVEFQDDSRIGSNRTPRREQFPIPSLARTDLIEKNLRGVTNCNNVAARAEVFKIGSRTGVTRGSYDKLKTDVNFPAHDRPYGMQSSSEHSFVYKGDTNPQPFCNHEDSGSFFWTGRRDLIAQFHGGPKAETLTEGSLMYATDAEELLKDMNDFAGPEYTITMATD